MSSFNKMNSGQVVRSLIALLLVVFLPFAVMIWIRIQQETGFTVEEMIRYPLLFGGAGILLLLILKRYFLKEPLKDFNAGVGTWITDIGWGFGLALIYFILFYLERATLMNVLEFRSNTELLGVVLDLRENPLRLFLWFGPVLWIGVALYEELIRVFLLDSLWKFSEKMIWIVFSIVLSGALMGLVHWSQGPYGIVTIAIKGMVSGFFFYKVRRLFPLVLAHVLYDGIQVGLLLLTYPG
jgi:membrane protease YdiL (CAAX protease family)